MTSANHAPEGGHTITPRIICADTPALLDFLRDVFDAEGGARDHAERYESACRQ